MSSILRYQYTTRASNWGSRRNLSFHKISFSSGLCLLYQRISAITGNSSFLYQFSCQIRASCLIFWNSVSIAGIVSRRMNFANKNNSHISVIPYSFLSCQRTHVIVSENSLFIVWKYYSLSCCETPSIIPE